MNGMAACDRIFKLLDSDELEERKEDFTKELSHKSDIEVDNITFSYDGERNVINNVSTVASFFPINRLSFILPLNMKLFVDIITIFSYKSFNGILFISIPLTLILPSLTLNVFKSSDAMVLLPLPLSPTPTLSSDLQMHRCNIT